MNNKLKIINSSCRHSLTQIERFAKEVASPLGINLPDGEYMLRGNKKDHAKYYLVKEGRFFLQEDKIKDSGHYMCEAAEFRLFPDMSTKEWETLKAVPRKYLTKDIKRAVYGYSFYLYLRSLRRNIALSYIRECKKRGVKPRGIRTMLID